MAVQKMAAFNFLFIQIFNFELNLGEMRMSRPLKSQGIINCPFENNIKFYLHINFSLPFSPLLI